VKWGGVGAGAVGRCSEGGDGFGVGWGKMGRGGGKVGWGGLGRVGVVGCCMMVRGVKGWGH
jgi:hypothetical protein